MVTRKKGKWYFTKEVKEFSKLTNSGNCPKCQSPVEKCGSGARVKCGNCATDLVSKRGKWYLGKEVEEYLSSSFVEKFIRCPKCRVLIERIAGCNMMRCQQCSTRFCYVCGKVLESYAHFADPESPCYEIWENDQ